MAYDEALAARVRAAMAGRDGLSERKMFGGVCFMLHGNMFAGVESGRIMLRVGPDRFEAALARPGASPMDFTGRPMTGFVFVDSSAVESDGGLQDWLQEKPSATSKFCHPKPTLNLPKGSVNSSALAMKSTLALNLSHCGGGSR
jgi:TfoX/Sxy family transcriptional regulator of competence genes